MTSIVAVAVAFLLVAVAASIVFAEDPNNPSFEAAHAGPPGPISTYPASWDFCRPRGGTTTTVDDIVAGLDQPLPNETLNQIYSAIVNSTAFKTESGGHSWVTIYWGLQEGRGPLGSYHEVVGQFLLLSGDKPYTVIQAEYDLSTFAVGAQNNGFVCGG